MSLQAASYINWRCLTSAAARAPPRPVDVPASLHASQRSKGAAAGESLRYKSFIAGCTALQPSPQRRTNASIMADQSNARHKPRKDGLAQTTKKAADRFRAGGQQTGKHKTRAFGVANLGRSKRSLQRNADRSHRKEVAATIRRDSGVAPTVIVVCGPRGSGKTTLIKSLVKLHTRHAKYYTQHILKRTHEHAQT